MRTLTLSTTPRRAGTVRSLTGRLREPLRFGAVGLLSAVLDVGGGNLLRFGLGAGPLTAKTIAVTAAAGLAYLGNRFWTFRHRQHTGMPRQFLLFCLLNGAALLISLACVGCSSYLLGLRGPLAYNVSANVVGLGLGTAFRYLSYRRWVFPARLRPAGCRCAGPACPEAEIVWLRLDLTQGQESGSGRSRAAS
jgi:putative flippase GtrA